ncbi:MAG: leucine-rich repeat domain-containing protein [Lachnospiraceae bacterium]|nr:leucine-rich repeat domain-containing protein [Lachnospiraceae bacterium]
MAKTQKRRKKNFRLRRSVRRTLGALFLMTAIIVAAIPFPDAAATEEVPPNSEKQDNSSTVAFVYGGEDQKVKDLDIEGNALELDGVTRTSSTLVQVGTNLKYEWQYEYQLIKDTTNAVITKYNDAYSEKNITLSPTANSNTYVSVNSSDFDSFFSTTTDTLQVTYDDWVSNPQSNAILSFSYYFPKLYSQFLGDCESYKKYLSLTEEQQKTYNGIKDKNLVTKTGEVKTLEDATLKKAYYCEYQLPIKNSGLNGINRTDYELIQALKPTGLTSGIINDVVYILKLKTNIIPPGGYAADNKGYVYSATNEAYEIKGIGKDAFKTVKSAMTLVLPDNLLYIADSAFEESFVTAITIGNVKQIGNRAFKNSQLETITWKDITTTAVIGAEAFSKTNITSVSFPSSISTIGEGAFSFNQDLGSISFSDKSKETTIGAYAFYECPKLGNLDLTNHQITAMGDAAFAIQSVDNGYCQTFNFPATISDDDKLGDFVLAGRSGLKNVTMPLNLGLREEAKLKDHIFQGCSGLSCVTFPDNGNGSSGYIRFNDTIFKSVANPEFYVYGPQYAMDNQTKAYPRTSTWGCKMVDNSLVPYMYKADGKEFYEVSDGKYVKLIDSQGILQSIELVDNSSTDLFPLTIEGNVGNRTVVGIADGCITTDLLNRINGLRIEDGVEIKDIGNGVFANAPELETVYIGDKVQTLGNDIFNNCEKLKKVTLGKGINKIGDGAFKGCKKLTNIVFKKPDNPENFPVTNIGKEAFQIDDQENINAKLIFEGLIHPSYGPYVYAMDPETFVNRSVGSRVCYKSGDPMGLTVILDNTNNYPTLVDYRTYSDLQYIPAALNGSDTKDSNLKTKYEDPNQERYMTSMENDIIHALYNVVIPEGVKSIDVSGFINGDSLSFDGDINSKDKNAVNVALYLSENAEANGESIGLNADKFESYQQYGLFNGDYPDDTNDQSQGNDVVKTVTMYDVVYLPNADKSVSDNGINLGAFYNCDNLREVDLGDDMQDVGSVPFLSSYELQNVTSGSLNDSGQPKYECVNQVLYENLDEGTKKIVEILSSRGNNGNTLMELETDPYLENVSEMAMGAGADVPELSVVDFTGNTILREIPDKAFIGSNRIDVVLPSSIRTIGLQSFAQSGDVRLSIYGREVSLATDAFEDTKNAVVFAFDDSAAYNTAKKIESLYPNVSVRVLDNVYRVQFFDYDGITPLSEVQYVEHGGNAEEPEEPIREGYIFKDWNKSFRNITEDTDIIALYDVDPNGPLAGGGTGGTGGTNKPGEGNDGVQVPGGTDINGDGIPDYDENGNRLYTLTVSNGTGGGRYPAGKKVAIQAGAAPDGAGFTHWSSTNAEVIFNDATKPSTTLTMPAADTTVVSNFAGYYRLDVVYGSGSGSYPAGAKVEIKAVDAPQGRSFASWKSSTSGLTIENSRKQTTTVTMPKSNATVTATYMDNGSLSGNSTNKNSQNGTRVQITKPGIPNTDKASAYVSGSSDSFIVKISESAEATEAVQKALQAKYPDMTRVKYFAMDISLYDATGTRKITDTTGLKINITIPIPEALKEYAGNNKIAAVVNGQIEDLAPKFVTIDGVPCISFTATHFSPYTVYVDTANLTVTNTLDSTPKTGDGIHPKWFLSIGLACISMILFLKKDKKYTTRLS